VIPTRAIFISILFLLLLPGCGDPDESTGAAAPETSAAAADATQPAGEPKQADVEADAGDVPDDDAEEIAPESLSQVGRIELKQYTVAYIGSGSMGGGTLFLDGKSYPFKIAGLGVGGIGASAMDATGNVYNLSSPEAFPGSYGNARVGMTAGHSGEGRLWLKNPAGVVIELWTQMSGLALSGGVDGILIQWDDGGGTVVGEVVEGSADVVEDTIDVGADVVEGTLDAIKRPFQ
jgi:hypothetical protein